MTIAGLTAKRTLGFWATSDSLASLAYRWRDDCSCLRASAEWTRALATYVRSMESDPVVAVDRRRSHVIDVGRRLAGIDALKMYDRNDRSPVAGRRERQRRNEEGSHTHRRENGRGDAGGSL